MGWDYSQYPIRPEFARAMNTGSTIVTFNGQANSPSINNAVQNEADADYWDNEFQLSDSDLAILAEIERERESRSSEQDAGGLEGEEATPTNELDNQLDQIAPALRHAMHKTQRFRMCLESDNSFALANESLVAPFFARHHSDDASEDEDGASVASDAEEDDGAKDTGGKWTFQQPKCMPNWLYSFFQLELNTYLNHKAVADKRTKAPPQIYSQDKATFWYPRRDPIFSLAKGQFTPKDFYMPNVFLWIPHFLVTQLNCPKCGKKLDLNCKAPPRRVYGLEQVYWVVTWNYRCKAKTDSKGNVSGCRSTFRGWSKEILASLPSFLATKFPAHLSKRAALDVSLCRLLLASMREKGGISGLRKYLKELYTHYYDRMHLQYAEAAKEREDRHYAGQDQESPQGVSRTQTSMDQYVELASVKAFGHWADPQGFAGNLPSKNYLISMGNTLVEAEELAHDQMTALLPSNQPFCSDDSHKVTKHLAKVDGTPVFTALHTIMAGFFIRGQAFTYTKSHSERAPLVAGIADSVVRFQTGIPPMWINDDPPANNALLAPFCDSIGAHLAACGIAKQAGSLELPSGFSKIVCNSDEEIASAFKEIVQDARHGEAQLYHVDAEWNTSRRVGISLLIICKHSDPSKAWFIRVIFAG